MARKARHEAECDADDERKELAEVFAKRPNALWGVYDLESIKGERVTTERVTDDSGHEVVRRTSWRQQPVMANLYFSQELADQANGGELFGRHFTRPLSWKGCALLGVEWLQIWVWT